MFSTLALNKFASSVPRFAAPVSLRVGGGVRFSSTRHDNDPEVLEREKQRNLSKSQHKTSTPHEHAPGWNEHLASDSEASVKADRSHHAPSEKLQSDTVNYVHSRHQDDGTHSQDSKERMDGPLSSAEPGEGKKDESVKRTTSETR
ncbi:hypothetical protein B0H17DRAFT_1001264 [Mycena rosella]|uniref:Uncharacterized protein n=1 Tax=Mycena rosella TaxID=1033263 RepID=A0AAD7M9I8_MYCRO|nr:hypothetical protein B0H17DRAFT_1001264 [Mycena rosella]